MNQTQKHTHGKKLLALLLALIMTVSLLPMSVFATEPGAESAPAVTQPAEDTQEPAADAAPAADTADEPAAPADEAAPVDETADDTADVPAGEPAALPATQSGDVAVTAETLANNMPAFPSDFIRVFHLDCGRKYFSVDEIEGIIDQMAASNYTHIELAFGNDGFRFLLNDMAVGSYNSDQVKKAITDGNNKYSTSKSTANTTLSEDDMDIIIAYATSKNISVIPLLNSPGHMDAIIDCMEYLGMTNVAFTAGTYGTSERTINLENTDAVTFTKALVQKYAQYFKNQGCTFFNMGADEYANDKLENYNGMGFGYLIDQGKYNMFLTYVNEVAAIIKNAGMIPMAFNDGIYYNSNASSDTFDADIAVCYWTSGWNNYKPAPATFLTGRGHKIINTNDAWYYVLGRSTGTYALGTAKSGVTNTSAATVPGSSGVTPAGCMLCLWCDTPSVNYSDSEVNNVTTLISTLASSNPAYFVAATTEDGDSSTGGDAQLVEKTISLTVGETTTDTIEGSYAGSHTTDPAGIATAKGGEPYTEEDTPASTTKISMNEDGTYKGAICSGENWLTLNSDGTIGSTTNDGEATEFTVVRSTTNYTIYANGRYLTVTQSGNSYSLSSSTNKVNWHYSNINNRDGFYYGEKSSRYLTYSNGEWTLRKNSDNTAQLYKVEPAKTGGTKTDVTFTGVSVGTTYVTIGNVRYTINVTDKAPDNAMTSDSITLEYWITNIKVSPGETYDSSNTSKIITNTSTGITSAEGVDIKTLAITKGTNNQSAPVYYWQTVRLDKDNHQTADAYDDETADGTTLTHVRYHGGAWQYKTVDGIWHYFLSTDQLVAYYLQKIDVTPEVDTYVKDWGHRTNGDSIPSNTSNTDGQVALTIAVVYPDGTVSPAEGDMFQKSTMIFNYWSNRDIGIVAPANNSDYAISKITVTNGQRTRADQSGYDAWYTTDTITWDKKTNAAGTEWYDETEYWNKDSGTTPMVNGLTSNITWSGKNNAKLVLIYLETVVKETNLNVQYIDMEANNYVFYSYQVAMKYNQGEVAPTFTTALKNDTEVIGNKGSWNSNDSSSTDYLPDTAYVTNSSDIPQTFSKNITTIPNIDGVYGSGMYQYIKADISEDGKTLRLYYDLKPVQTKTYVVDFGLPVVIPLSEFYATANVTADKVESVSFNENSVEHERTGVYGVGKIKENNLTYTLTKTLDSSTVIPVYVKLKDTTTKIVASLTIIPASNVYYEDSFARFTNGTGAAACATWSTDGTTTSATQTLEELGNKTNVYGYDAAYNNCTTFSMGSAKKVTVSKIMADDWTDDSTWPTATFTFKGTGFDVISLTDNNSGLITYEVKNSQGETEISKFVDNYYGYKYENGQFAETATSGENALYQLPVIKVSGLEYDTYTVTITAAYGEFFDKTGDNEYSFWLDAIRVYDPMGKAYDYTSDGEGYPQYFELRNALANTESGYRAVLIEGEAEANQTEYKNFGPNHEVYLAKNQTLAFKLENNLDSIASVQLGLKSVDGDATYKINEGTEQKVITATDMYYDITNVAKNGGTVLITNTDDNILSLTNVKVTFTAADKTTELALMGEETVNQAVQMVRAMYAAPVAPEVFAPERFEASWNRDTVRAGQKATLTVKTSKDVACIEVDGQIIDTYRTRTQRTGWGASATTVTYRQFTYTITAAETADYTVTAFNADNVASESITATLTVQTASQGSGLVGWLESIFGRWF